MQQSPQVRDVDVGARALGDRLRDARDGRGVEVQVPDRAPAVAGGALEEAERRGLDRELRDRLAAVTSASSAATMSPMPASSLSAIAWTRRTVALRTGSRPSSSTASASRRSA
jgi:hypothetical protein